MNTENKPLVSIYTCVYNRADKIHRALESVKKQTYKNIEHIIVDDGSTDDLDTIIEKYNSEIDYPLQYIKKENGGKYTALNICWDKANGEWMIQLDSDDELYPHAIEYLVGQIDLIPENEKNKYWCILGRCITQFGDVCGENYPDNINSYDHKTAYEMAKKVSGEKIGLQRAAYLKKYRFPEPIAVKCVSEHIVWVQIDDIYRTWYTNEVVRIYYVNEGENLSEKPHKPQQFADKAYTAKWNLLNRKKYKINYWVDILKYCIGYILSTDYYKENNPYFKDFDLSDKLVLALSYIPMLAASGLYYIKFIRKFKT